MAAFVGSPLEVSVMGISLGIILLSAVLAFQDSPAQTDQQIAEGISQTSTSFHDRITQLRESAKATAGSDNELSQREFNLALARTKLELLEKLPEDATPLRNYIERHFPGPVIAAQPNGNITGSAVDKTVNATDSLLEAVKSASPYRLDLIVDSDPRDALFQLQQPTGDVLSRGTRGEFTNVWRGEYSYSVSKAGQKTINGTVDLIREKGNTLVCHFVENDSQDSARPCDLIYAQ
jgi:hypothetical protein